MNAGVVVEPRGPTTTRSAALPHVPALDGLRGLAVGAVLVMHAGATTWLPGGFLGVSLFFTLSGYLIGSLVLAEVEADQRVGLAAFWARRVRRLVPAVVLTVLGVVVMSRFVELPGSTRAELLGGLGYVANWVQVSGGESYAALFESPSAVTHLWSLAIEEQFYVVFPFLAWLVARRFPSRMRATYVVGGSAVVVLGAVYTAGIDDRVLAYYGTLSRVPEIALGLVLAGLRPMGHLSTSPSTRVPAELIGAAALVATGALWFRTDLSDPWLYSGGLALVAVASTGLLVGATADGRLARVLSAAPLTALGRISYGLYLYHWPVVVLLSPPRVDLDPVPSFVARTALSLLLAIASYRLVEQPIRRGRLGSDAAPGAVIVAGLAVLALTAAVVWVGVRRPEAPAGPSRPAPAVVTPGTAPPSEPAEVPGSEAAPEPTTPVVAIFGDSVPNWLVRDGGWALDPAQVQVIDGTSEGCDGAEGAPVGRAGTGVVVTVPESCTGWRSQYPPVVDAADVDVAVLAVGTGAVLDRELDGGFVGPCTELAADWYRADVVARLRFLADHADRVVVVLPAWAEGWSGWVNPADHRERTDCVRATLGDAIEEAAVEPPVQVVDLGAHLCPGGADRCEPVRQTDGVHIDADRAGDVLNWLVDAALEVRPTG